MKPTPPNEGKATSLPYNDLDNTFLIFLEKEDN
jgi:hypothetical protein